MYIFKWTNLDKFGQFGIVIVFGQIWTIWTNLTGLTGLLSTNDPVGAQCCCTQRWCEANKDSIRLAPAQSHHDKNISYIIYNIGIERFIVYIYIYIPMLYFPPEPLIGTLNSRASPDMFTRTWRVEDPMSSTIRNIADTMCADVCPTCGQFCVLLAAPGVQNPIKFEWTRDFPEFDIYIYIYIYIFNRIWTNLDKK